MSNHFSLSFLRATAVVAADLAHVVIVFAAAVFVATDVALVVASSFAADS